MGNKVMSRYVFLKLFYTLICVSLMLPYSLFELLLVKFLELLMHASSSIDTLYATVCHSHKCGICWGQFFQ